MPSIILSPSLGAFHLLTFPKAWLQSHTCSDSVVRVTILRVSNHAKCLWYIFLNSWKQGVVDEESEFIVTQSVKAINEWKAHILRSVNQDQARQNVLDNMGPNDVLL